MAMEVIQLEKIAVVVPGVARLNAAKAVEFREVLKSALAPGASDLLLDLGSVTLVDSTILGVVVGVFKILPQGGRLILCDVSSNVGSILHLTQLDKVFGLYKTREEAIQALR